MALAVPKNFALEYSRDDIAAAVARMGEELTPWAQSVWEETGKDVLGIPVLRGGIFFYADLVREIQHSIDCAPVRTWGYEIDKTQVMREKLGVNLDGVNASGRSVLLIDDICDSGRTLAALKAAFLEHGAREVRSAVLVKRVLDEETFNPEYVGFLYEGPEWFVGYGMEDKERWRNLDSIYTIKV